MEQDLIFVEQFKDDIMVNYLGQREVEHHQGEENEGYCQVSDIKVGQHPFHVIEAELYYAKDDPVLEYFEFAFLALLAPRYPRAPEQWVDYSEQVVHKYD